VHPLDDDVEDEPLPPRPQTLYLGGAGVVAALHRLGSTRDWAPYLEGSVEQPDFPAEDRRSLLAGEVGIRLVLQRIEPSAENLERLAELIAANAQDERCELMLGSPGTILAGRELGLDVAPSVEWLEAQRGEDGLWTQRLFGRVDQYLGPAHGFASCVLALDGVDDLSETLERFAVQKDGLVNWPPLARTRLDAQRDGLIRTQWCHGAPGIVATLAPWMDEQLAVAGGELTWRAGPLRKGPGLCHGTAGNGYAFLALFEKSGDELWLQRARAFAMHAAEQVDSARVQYGRGRYSLWTGDLGTALYLADCVDGTGRLPLP
jgi:hypothetical protein